MPFSYYNVPMADAIAEGHGAFAHPHKNVTVIGVGSGMRVADFGAGSGAYTLSIAERVGPTGRVYAIDIQKDLLRRLSNAALTQGFKNIDIIWADLEVSRASKLADNSLDLVLVSNVIFQMHEKSRILIEAARIVKRDGFVALIDWSGSFGGMGPIKSEVVSKSRALELAEEAGLELSREFPAGAHHY